jgi:hypothetical protein
VSKPPSKPESVACIPPASMAAAYDETSTICVPEERAAPGPPAKKFFPEPETGEPGVPYATAVKGPAGVQPGGTATALLLVAPAPASAPGFWSKFVPDCERAAGTTATARTARASSRRTDPDIGPRGHRLKPLQQEATIRVERAGCSRP